MFKPSENEKMKKKNKKNKKKKNDFHHEYAKINICVLSKSFLKP